MHGFGNAPCDAVFIRNPEDRDCLSIKQTHEIPSGSNSTMLKCMDCHPHKSAKDGFSRVQALSALARSALRFGCTMMIQARPPQNGVGCRVRSCRCHSAMDRC